MYFLYYMFSFVYFGARAGKNQCSCLLPCSFARLFVAHFDRPDYLGDSLISGESVYRSSWV